MVPLGLKSTSETSMVRTAVSALGLLIILPASVILYLFRENLEGKGIVLFLVLVLAILGFWLIFAFVRAITQVQRGLSGMSAGEVDSLQIQGAPAQLQEMGEIINSLNTLTREFRENTKQLESFIRQFATLSELTEVTAKVPDINDLLSLVLDKAMSASLARRGTVLLLSAETSMLDIVATEGWDGESLDPVALHESLAHRVIATGKPLLVHDLDDEASLEQCNNSQRYTSPSCLIMPLKAKTSVFGAVCLSEKVSGAFTDSDMQFLTVLLGQVGFAIENANLLKQARDAAQNLKARVRTQEVALDDAHGRIAQAEKLSALGQLAGGVAHDFNNMLQAILGYTKMARRGLDRGDHRFRNLEEVRKAAERAATLTSQLLAFGRRQVLEPVDLDVNVVIEDVMRMLKRVLGEHIDISMARGSSVKAVHADPRQLEQVLLNLCINARDAMPEGGMISIETSNSILDEEFCRENSWAQPGSFVQIAVTDAGCGMDEQTLDQVFEPFFTTKEVGKGTGLGLATVYGIVKQHNGLIVVESGIGLGSTFRVYLPSVDGPPEIVDKKCTAQVSGGTETILVAEDEETVRNLHVSVLEAVGYEVLSAADGEEAVRTFEEHQERISLAIIDAVMPRLSGRQVYERITELKPDLAILFCSGYSSDVARTGFIQKAGLPLLPKPFDPDDLLIKVRECLDIGTPQG